MSNNTKNNNDIINKAIITEIFETYERIFNFYEKASKAEYDRMMKARLITREQIEDIHHHQMHKEKQGKRDDNNDNDKQ